MLKTKRVVTLRSYSSSARSLVASKGNKKPSHIGIYAAAAGSALAMAATADASIIYSGPQNITAHVSTNHRSSKNIQFGLENFSIGVGLFTASGGRLKFGTAGVVANAGNFISTGGSADRLLPLPQGFRISSNAAFGADLILFARGIGTTGFADTSGQWIAGQTAFAGIHNGPEFGWIRLRYDNNAQGFPDTITAIDWAYNTNGPINAGQTATPEPGPLSLLLLAGGASGVLALRRRKKAAQA